VSGIRSTDGADPPLKGDYRTVDDSGFFLVSSMIIYVRGARHDQQSIPRAIPPLTFFYDARYVPDANEAERLRPAVAIPTVRDINANRYQCATKMEDA